MLVIPAIDLKDGQCVRLRQGDMADSTVFSDDPVAMAQRWFDEGARRLHIVDLDGAFAGEPSRSTRCKRRAPSPCQRLAIATGSLENTVLSAMSPCRRRTH